MGNVALGAFSAGCGVVSSFLAVNARHRFTTRTLREVYIFEPPGSLIPSIAGTVRNWASGSSEKVIRWYSQTLNAASYDRLLDRPVPRTDQPFIVESTPVFAVKPTKTVAFLPRSAWTDLTGVPRNFQYVHQVIASTMLTDALRRSDF